MAPFSKGPVAKGKIAKRRSGKSKSHRDPQRLKKDGFAVSRIIGETDQVLPATEARQGNAEVDSNDIHVSSDEESVHNAESTNPYSSLLQSLTDDTRTQTVKKQKAEINQTQGTYESEIVPKAPEHTHDAEPYDIHLEDPDPDDERESGHSVDFEYEPDDAFETHFCQSNEDKLSKFIQRAHSDTLSTSTSHLEGLWKTTAVSSESGSHDTKPRFPMNLSPHAMGIKNKLQTKGSSVLSNVSGIESYLANLLFRYTDILFTVRNRSNASKLMRMVCLHALNHVLKTRDRVLKNNEKAAQSAEVDDGRLCDQGFTRPKVLFILPTRQACYRAVTEIISLYEPEQQENRKRFQNNFRNVNEAISDNKPQDFRDLFSGNDDDMFRVGLKFTRKTAKFFAPFYSSDVIFASPLGLRTAIGEESAKKKDYDYLSSIELVIVDHADALLMQNWEHVEFIFDHLNLQPREAHGCDFGRVRSWYLNGHAKYVRQTVVLTAFNTPEINNLFNFKMSNFDGKVKVGEAIYKGLIAAPNALFKQIFYRFDATEPSSEPDARFKYFTSKLVPQIVKRTRDSHVQKQGILVFISSYMDFVRVRNFFANSAATRDISFASLSEYAPAPDIARARSHFLNGKHSVLLYSGRIHHFRRYELKGTKQVIFYSLPDNPLFWKEVSADFPARSVAAGKADGSEVTVQALFSKWDALRLERIVGTKRMKQMLTDKSGDVFEFIP